MNAYSSVARALSVPFIALILLGTISACGGSASSPEGVAESEIRSRFSDRTLTMESISTSVSGETAKVIGSFHLEKLGGFAEDVRDFVIQLRRYDDGWKVESFDSTSRHLPEGLYK